MLYKKVDSKLGIGITGFKRTTKYYEKPIQVPRCETCLTEHKRPGKPALWWGIIAGIVCFAITYFTAKGLYIVILTSLIVGFIVALSFILARFIETGSKG